MTQIAFKKALTNILDDFLEKNLDFAQTQLVTQQNLKQKISNQVDTYIFKAIQQKLFPKGYSNYELFSFAVTVVLLLEYYEHYQVTGQLVNIQHFYKPLLQRQNSKLAFQALAQLIFNKDFDLFLSCYNIHDVDTSKQDIYEFIKKMPIRNEVKTTNKHSKQMFLKQGDQSELCNFSPVANQPELDDITIQFQAQSYDILYDMNEELFDNYMEESILDSLFFIPLSGEDECYDQETIYERGEGPDQEKNKKEQKLQVQQEQVFHFSICIKKYITESPKIVQDALSNQEQSSMLNKIINRKNDVNPLFKNKKKAGK